MIENIRNVQLLSLAMPFTLFPSTILYLAVARFIHRDINHKTKMWELHSFPFMHYAHSTRSETVSAFFVWEKNLNRPAVGRFRRSCCKNMQYILRWLADGFFLWRSLHFSSETQRSIEIILCWIKKQYLASWVDFFRVAGFFLALVNDNDFQALFYWKKADRSLDAPKRVEIELERIFAIFLANK